MCRARFRCKKQRQGLKGKELAYWHPYQKGGYWEWDAKANGVLSPREEKEMLERNELAWLTWD